MAFCAHLRCALVCGLLKREFPLVSPQFKVSDIAMELVKQDVFVASTRADLMKVVQDDPGAQFFLALMGFIHLPSYCFRSHVSAINRCGFEI